MPIRITGMYSGLDTESIINELASAQSMKKNKLVKAQTKLSWKQDAWKALNTKIYSLYSNSLSNLRFEGSYKKKATKVSNANAASIVTSADALNGVQSLQIDKLAKAGYVTGGEISKSDGGKVSASTKLSELGITDGSKFTVALGNGKSTEIELNGDMKVSDLVAKLNNAGVSANFDVKNQRMFVASNNTGKDLNFVLSGSNAGGMTALQNLGLLTQSDIDSGDYRKWADYKNADGTYTADYQAAFDKEVAKRAAALKAQNDSLAKTNETLQQQIDKYQAEDGYAAAAAKGNADWYLEQLYGPLVQAQNDDGSAKVDDQGNPVMERKGGLKALVDDSKKAYEKAQKALKDLKASGTATDAEIAAATQAQTDAKDLMDAQQKVFNERTKEYNLVNAVESRVNQIDENNNTIAKNALRFDVTTDANGKETITGTQLLKDEVEADFEAKINTAKDVVDNNLYTASAGSTKTTGRDAEIYLNGAYFTSDTNTFTINGLTITALAETNGEEITLTTTEDTDGIYDMIKDFFKEYNALINEMDALYNADSAKGYEPLLSEEKAALSDSEIEEWEKKVKDSLLRRDSTLSAVSSAMKNALMKGAEVNGVQMYLSDFGIGTLGYFNAADNEKNAYHIDGDPDDPATKANDDKLRALIASDPDTVAKFFSQLSKNLYDELGKQMTGTTMSSAFTVYNDKQMKEEYTKYTEKISKEETKLNNMIDKWYAKFSAMEVAMSKLESKNNALAGLFGG